MIEELVVFNRGQFHIRLNERDLGFGPSPGGRFFYLTVKNPGDADNVDNAISSWYQKGKHTRILEENYDGTKVYPREYEAALGAWAARLCGFSTLVLKTPEGEHHIPLS